MEKFWTVGGVRKAYKTPPYAIIDLEKAAQSRLQFVNDNVGTYITHSINNEELLIRTTYERALRHAKEAPVGLRNLLFDRGIHTNIAASERRRKETSQRRSLLVGCGSDVKHDRVALWRRPPRHDSSY